MTEERIVNGVAKIVPIPIPVANNASKGVGGDYYVHCFNNNTGKLMLYKAERAKPDGFEILGVIGGMIGLNEDDRN